MKMEQHVVNCSVFKTAAVPVHSVQDNRHGFFRKKTVFFIVLLE